MSSSNQRGFNKPSAFSFKYTPLQLRGLEQQQNPRQAASLFPPALSFTQRHSNTAAGTPSVDALNTSILENTEFQGNDTQGVLYNSIENITSWCQAQENSKRDVEKQFENSLVEVGRLKARLESAANEIQTLQATNKQLQVK